MPNAILEQQKNKSYLAQSYFAFVVAVVVVTYYIFNIKYPMLLKSVAIRDVINSIYTSAIVWQLFLFLLQCQKIHRKKSVEGLSLVMFLGFNIGQFFCIINGYVYRDWTFMNGFISYFIVSSYITWSILYYRIFDKNIKKLILTLIVSLAVLLIVGSVFVLSKHLLVIVNVFFSLAIIWNGLLYAAQIYKLCRSKKAGGIYTPMFIGFNAAFIVVWINGMFYGDKVLIYGYMPMILLCAAVVSLTLWINRRENKVG